MSVFGLFAAALFASALGGVLGMASGIFIVPILAILGGVEIHQAVAAGLVSVIACSCAGSRRFLDDGHTNVRLAIVLETATTAGALTGVLLAGLAPIWLLYALFSAVLIVSAVQMMQRRRVATIGGAAAAPNSLHASLAGDYPSPRGGPPERYEVGRLPLALALMYGAGALSAMLGIGSGVLKIPAMDTALRLPIKVSSATSTFMIGVTAAAGGLAYFARGMIDLALCAPILLGSVLGAILGARALRALSPERLRLLFAIVLVALAIQMAIEAFRS